LVRFHDSDRMTPPKAVMARARKPRVSAQPPAWRPQAAAALLDELIPLAEPAGHEVHQSAAVLEVGDPAQLLELAADPALRSYLLCRLAPQCVLVDPGRAVDLADALRRRGHTPKILKP
jgi:hypothetical protein